MTAKGNICKQPVVAIVGHIDHGKTTLLDYIRKTTVAARETGGITQRVSAYEAVHEGAEGARMITFIDTPGHEAFQKMRARGAKAADIAILVVAADDGVKPQTLEAYRAIQDAKVPFIVAFTKIDKDSANLDRAKESVMKNEIYLEGLGGDVPYVGVSGKSGAGVPELLDLITLVSDLHNISCNADSPVRATVIESTRDAKTGLSATVIIKEGTLSVGGFAVTGTALAPLRAIENFTGKKVNEIQCGKPARIFGFTEEPAVGAIVTVFKSKADAEKAVKESERSSMSPDKERIEEKSGRVTVRLLLKADAAGSLEALQHEIAKISVENIDLYVIAEGVGPITENDIKPLIGFDKTIVLGFNVKVDTSAKDLAERQRITIEAKPIIYELAEWLSKELVQYQPEPNADAVTGTVQILKHFSTSGSKHVVGGRVTDGALSLSDRVTIVRRGIEVGTGKVTNLQAKKLDVSAVPTGTEFGAQIETKADIIAGDILSAMHKR